MIKGKEKEDVKELTLGLFFVAVYLLTTVIGLKELLAFIESPYIPAWKIVSGVLLVGIGLCFAFSSQARAELADYTKRGLRKIFKERRN